MRLICITAGGAYILGVTTAEAHKAERAELAKPETVAVARFDGEGMCQGVSVDWADQPGFRAAPRDLETPAPGAPSREALADVWRRLNLAADEDPKNAEIVTAMQRLNAVLNDPLVARLLNS